MDQEIKEELINAIQNKYIERKDEGKFPSAHSEPFFYKAQNGNDYVLLRAKEKRFIETFKKQQLLYPFLCE